MQFGLKIWSVNHSSFIKMKEFHSKGIIDYVELYTYPDSFNPLQLEQLTDVPLIFHAPTFPHGMNLGEPMEKISPLIKDIRRYAQFFKENKIIFHPGVMVGTMETNLRNTIDNLTVLKDEFDIILENVPAIGIDDKSIMLAPTPTEFKKIKDRTDVKSCLDFGHAINSANYYGKDPFDFINGFLSLSPFMFHLSDGHFNSHIDVHLHYNQGSFPLEKIVRVMPEDGRLSLETPKKDYDHLSEDLSNLTFIKTLVPFVEIP